MLRRVSPKMEVPWTLVRGAPHDIQHLMQPVKIRQFRQKAQNQRQFGRGMVAKNKLNFSNQPWL